MLAVLAAGAVVLSASPAGAPEFPVQFITVDELKERIDRGPRPDIIDVRTWDPYVEKHIKGARSMPLRAVRDRAHEVSRTALVVFY